MQVRCPHCSEEFDVRDAEVLERLADEKAFAHAREVVR